MDKKFDLIIAAHSLEHLTNLKIFHKFNEALKPGGFLFFEVPYCPEEYFSGRPYDGPHLLFYTKKSIEKVSEKFNYEISRIDFSSYTLEEDYTIQKESKERYYKIQSNINFNIKKFLKKFIPQFIIKLKQTIRNTSNTNEMIKLGQFTINSGNNTYLRGILIKN